MSTSHESSGARQSVGLSRRSLLGLVATVGTAAGGGLLFGFSVPARSQGGARTSVIDGDGVEMPREGVFAPNAFIQIDRRGKVTLVMPKVEMGQGVYTSIPMLLAEELEVPLASVTLAHAPPNEKLFADPMLAEQLTGASTSIRYAWEPMRKAGASTRTLLVMAAAQRWKVDPSGCVAREGRVLHPQTSRSIGYGELVDVAARLQPPQDVRLKDPKDFKLIGTRVKRLDSPEKVNGAAVFGLDVRVPGMVYAAIATCPVFGGRLAKFDDTHTRKIPDVQRVVSFDNGVAVIGAHTWAARRGLQALEIQWDEGAGADVSTETIVTDLVKASQRSGAVARKEGDVEKAFANAKTRIDAIYHQPFLAHATMEPVNCTVHVRPDGCEVWVGTQVPGRVADAAAKVTGLPPEKIIVHNHLLGGGFGRRLEIDMVTQAAKVARQLNVPVKVVWTREEDIQHDMYRPYYYDRISAGLDANGMPVAWQHRIVGSSILARYAPAAMMKNGVDPDAVAVAAELPYDLPNQLVDYVRQEPRGIPTAFWRGVGPTRSAFVVETFIDELATHAKVDPVKYRQALLGKSPRALNVLNEAVRAARWAAGAPQVKGKGRGVSLMHAFGSFFAMVVDVTVDDGEVSVDHVTCAVDCGMAVNPDTIEAQMQGGIVFGLTAALYGEITFKNGRVEQSNFNDYRVLRINETPDIDVHLVKSSEAPGGIGEPGTSALQPALANAIFAATGKRLHALPIGDQLKSNASGGRR
ncbi:molybdopterin cofactor-binding domain-containing protein [Variovorax paradoxus]|uniref:xanthine dehydrogenase family protein molybdopterin-binding subunit n=1 Tax=Variovorax paradoxus TaxID=34073 RepID=UPI003ED022D1